MMNPFAVGIRQSLHQILNVLLVLSTALMVWKGLSILTDTEAPIVVVLTESMEPAFCRGDLLFLYQPSRPLDVGDIIVYKLDNKEIPIVHRVLNIHSDTDFQQQHILTKGDNNSADDRGIFDSTEPGKLWLSRDQVMGAVSGYVPYVGYLTILMNDYPSLKIALLGSLALFALFTRE